MDSKVKKLILFLFLGQANTFHCMENKNSSETDFFTNEYLPIELQKYIFQIAIDDIFKKNKNYDEIAQNVMHLLKNLLPVNKAIRSLKNDLLQYFAEQIREHLEIEEKDYSELDIDQKNEKLREALIGNANKINLSQAVNAILAGADPNLCVDSGMNTNRCALSWAAVLSYPELVIFLLIKRADIDFKNINERTPLMIAVDNDDEEIVRILLNFGADIYAKDIHDQTALDIAKEKGTQSIIRMLEETISLKNIE